jgi:hypothetical protein
VIDIAFSRDVVRVDPIMWKVNDRVRIAVQS